MERASVPTHEVHGSSDVMDLCGDGVSFDLRESDPTICDRQLNLEGVVPGEIGQRRMPWCHLYVESEKAKVDSTETESRKSESRPESDATGNPALCS